MKNNQIVNVSLVLFPLIWGAIAFKDLFTDVDATTYSLFGGAMGLGVGLLLRGLFLNKSMPLKVGVLFAVMIGPLVASLLGDAASGVDMDWQEFEMQGLHYRSQLGLDLINQEIPGEASSFYKVLEVYSDQQSKRIVTGTYSELFEDTLSLDASFDGAMSTMLQQLKIDESQTTINVIRENEDERAATFQYEHNDWIYMGYGFMRKEGNRFYTLWLMPISTGFSEEYVEAFDESIWK